LFNSWDISDVLPAGFASCLWDNSDVFPGGFASYLGITLMSFLVVLPPVFGITLVLAWEEGLAPEELTGKECLVIEELAWEEGLVTEELTWEEGLVIEELT